LEHGQFCSDRRFAIHRLGCHKANGQQKNDFHIIVLDRPVDRRRIARSLRHRLCLDAAIAPQHRRLPTALVAHDLLRLIKYRMGPGLLVIKHRAEIAHVDPAFKEVKLNLFSPMASERNAPPFWSILKSERY
jgi:hypothetical protein